MNIKFCRHSMTPGRRVVPGKKTGYRLFAFSNGSADAVETLLKNAGIRDYFIGVVSVDEMKSTNQTRGI